MPLQLFACIQEKKTKATRNTQVVTHETPAGRDARRPRARRSHSLSCAVAGKQGGRPSLVACLQTFEKAVTCEDTLGPARCLCSYSHVFRRRKRRPHTTHTSGDSRKPPPGGTPDGRERDARTPSVRRRGGRAGRTCRLFPSSTRPRRSRRAQGRTLAL